MRIILLGGGRMAQAIIHDLYQDFDLTVADRDEDRLHQLGAQFKVATEVADLADPAKIKQVIRDYDLVVGSVPGALGFQMAQAVIEAGKNMVDISFCPEDILHLDSLAKKKGVSIIADMGVAPGMSNLILGHHYFTTMQVESFACYVGGLPVERSWPFGYKAPFSPIDVIEEYTRPARIKRNGKVFTLPALTERERLQFKGIGDLEAFNTDGLRTLLFTMDIPEMIEKTLRYAGHANLMEALRQIGYFNTDPITVNGHAVRPIDLTSALLLPQWQPAPDEKEFTVMRVAVRGLEKGRNVVYTYDMVDYGDEATGLSSMARSTGFTCTAGVRLMAEGKIIDKGILPPELLAKDPEVLPFVLQHLADRGVQWEKH